MLEQQCTLAIFFVMIFFVKSGLASCIFQGQDYPQASLCVPASQLRTWPAVSFVASPPVLFLDSRPHALVEIQKENWGDKAISVDGLVCKLMWCKLLWCTTYTKQERTQKLPQGSLNHTHFLDVHPPPPLSPPLLPGNQETASLSGDIIIRLLSI